MKGELKKSKDVKLAQKDPEAIALLKLEDVSSPVDQDDEQIFLEEIWELTLN